MMPKTYTVSPEAAVELARIRRKVNNTAEDKRLRAVQLRGEGKKNAEIGVLIEASPAVVSRWVSAFVKGGVDALLSAPRGGNRRNISLSDEAAFLSEFDKQAEQGNLVEVSAIKKAYEQKVGHSIGKGQIYRVLKRHGFRKIKPRSRHPKKATDEAIDASKKLTRVSEN
jgi:transposase